MLSKKKGTYMKKIFKNLKEENHHYLKLMGVIFASIVFFLVFSNIGIVRAALKKVLNVFTPLIVGFCFAFIFNIPLRLLETKIFGKLTRKGGKIWNKIKRPLCLTISMLSVFALVAILLAFVIPEFIQTCEKFFELLPSAMTDLTASINGLLARFDMENSNSFQIDWNMISSWALELLDQNQSQIAQSAVEIITGLFNTVLNFILGLVFSIYLLASKESLGRLMKSFVYSIMKRETAKKLISFVVLANKAFTGFVTGQCIEVLLIGVLCFIGMLIFQMPFAIMVSCIIAFTAFIPVFGPFIGTAIGAFLILVESPAKALAFVIFIIILQQLESNIIYPKIMGKQVGLPGIWVLIAVTIGGGLFGMLGILVSVPICSVLYTLFDKWIKKRLEERNICHKSMSHDSSEPKSIIEEIENYEFEEEYQDDFEDDVYTDEGEIRHSFYTSVKKAEATTEASDIDDTAGTADVESTEEKS